MQRQVVQSPTTYVAAYSGPHNLFRRRYDHGVRPGLASWPGAVPSLRGKSIRGSTSAASRILGGKDLPPDGRVYTDRVNGLLAAVYGNQHVLTSLADGINTRSVSTLLLAPAMPSDIRTACLARVRYLIADKRLAWSLPHVGIYIDGGEYPAGTRVHPPPASALTNFNGVSGAERIFDNGSIRIYDLERPPVRWQEVTARLALICGLFVMIVYNVNVWATAPVGLLAIAATVELAIRPYATRHR